MAIYIILIFLTNDAQIGSVGHKASPTFLQNNLSYLMTKILRLNKAKITIWKLWQQTTSRQKSMEALHLTVKIWMLTINVWFWKFYMETTYKLLAVFCLNYRKIMFTIKFWKTVFNI